MEIHILSRDLANSNNFLRVLKVTRNSTLIITHTTNSENVSNLTEGFEQLVFKEKATINRGETEYENP